MGTLVYLHVAHHTHTHTHTEIDREREREYLDYLNQDVHISRHLVQVIYIYMCYGVIVHPEAGMLEIGRLPYYNPLFLVSTDDFNT